MVKIFKNIIFLGSFILFLAFILIFYFSDENIKKTNKSRIFLSAKEKNNFDLPVLSSDTNDIIVYTDEVEEYKKKKKKYNFFDLIKKQSNE
tara:strand:+ start:664 stop:936 length:273 start_codon:yes stop_codon:yes gene_type:complete